jgi:hypothetical protein
MTGVCSRGDAQIYDIADRYRRHIEHKNRAIGTQRIGDLNKLFACRDGGGGKAILG